MKKDPYITTGYIWIVYILIKRHTPCIAFVIHESRNLMQARPKNNLKNPQAGMLTCHAQSKVFLNTHWHACYSLTGKPYFVTLADNKEIVNNFSQ